MRTKSGHTRRTAAKSSWHLRAQTLAADLLVANAATKVDTVTLLSGLKWRTRTPENALVRASGGTDSAAKAVLGPHQGPDNLVLDPDLTNVLTGNLAFNLATVRPRPGHRETDGRTDGTSNHVCAKTVIKC